MNRKYEIFSKFPKLNEYLKEYKENDEYDKYVFVYDWLDSRIDGIMWSIMRDRTSEIYDEDERDYIGQFDENELWVFVAENMLKQMLKGIKMEMTDEEAIKKMPLYLRKKYKEIEKEIEKVKIAIKLQK